MVAGKLILNKGWVYQLEHKTNKKLKFYIGSCYDMPPRFINHISNCNNTSGEKYNFEVYKYIREHGGIDNWEMKCLLTKKTYWYPTIESILIKRTWKNNTNSNIPNRKNKEWYQDNRVEQQRGKAKVHICNYCYCPYTVAHKTRHQRSTYCLQFQE
tara:strand:- start:194 stop:661 length:468 start_codon:yes stop_codon:yes gene_type:complete